MKIKLLTSLAGVDFSYAAGDVVELSEDDSQRLIERGLAEVVAKKKAVSREKVSEKEKE